MRDGGGQIDARLNRAEGEVADAGDAGDDVGTIPCRGNHAASLVGGAVLQQTEHQAAFSRASAISRRVSGSKPCGMFW